MAVLQLIELKFKELLSAEYVLCFKKGTFPSNSFCRSYALKHALDFLQVSELTGHHFTVFLTLQKFFCLRQLKMLNVYQPVAGYNTILGYKILYI